MNVEEFHTFIEEMKLLINTSVQEIAFRKDEYRVARNWDGKHTHFYVFLKIPIEERAIMTRIRKIITLTPEIYFLSDYVPINESRYDNILFKISIDSPPN